MRISISLRVVVSILGCCVVPIGCGKPPPAPAAAAAAARSAGGAAANCEVPSVSGQSSRPLDSRGVSFVDAAQERGLLHTWPIQRRPMTALDAFGSGCAAFDADDDGWQDVLLVAEPHPVFYRNQAGARFADVTADSGLDAAKGKWTGCAVGDYDADGLLDLLVTGYHCLALYKNEGSCRFRLVTEDSGLDAANHALWGASAGFMDLDGDNWLDLVILNYVDFGPDSRQYCEYVPGVISGCTPRSYPPERGEIWRNTGTGRFELVPAAAGMEQTTGVGLVLAFTDLEEDGRIDFYIGNDAVPADFLHNLGGMRFENIALASGLSVDDTASAIASMGADWGDFDRDGRLDLVVSNFQLLSFVVFQNHGDGSFSDISKRTGLASATRNLLGFGAKWIDFDNDGWPDIAFVNGHVYDNAQDVQPGAAFRQPVALFHNEQGKRFIDVAGAQGADVLRPILGRGSASADFDNDGLVDLLAVDFEGPVMLLVNRSRTEHHWLTLDLRGAAPNRFAHGARVTGKSGDQVWVSEVSPASSYLSSSDPRIHWGLGDLTQLDSLTIRWPSGREQTLLDVAADRILRVDENAP